MKSLKNGTTTKSVIKLREMRKVKINNEKVLSQIEMMSHIMLMEWCRNNDYENIDLLEEKIFEVVCGETKDEVIWNKVIDLWRHKTKGAEAIFDCADEIYNEVINRHLINV